MKQVGYVCLGGPNDGRRIAEDNAMRQQEVPIYPQGSLGQAGGGPGTVTSVPIQQFIDEILLFHRLTREQMAGIVEVQLRDLEALLAERKITLELDATAKAWLAERGYDPVYGARPLKRVLQRALQNPLATMILEGRIMDGERVVVTAAGDALAINGQAAQAAE